MTKRRKLPPLPASARGLKIGRFKKFLQSCGGQIMAETNEYELVRVKTDDGVLILYKNKIGILNWPNELRKAYFAYKSGGKLNWRAAAKVKTRRARSNVLIKTLWDRDGKNCWYCGIQLSYETSTIEHLFNVSHGGTNHIANLTTACNPCNQRAKNMCVTDKVKLRERLRRTK